MNNLSTKELVLYANKILEDFEKACNPKTISVFGDFHPRGGIKTQVVCEND